MTEETLLKISKKLNVLISLSLRRSSGEKDVVGKQKRKLGTGELARYLADFGLEAKDIAEILGAPLQSVRTLLTPKRRK